MIDYFKSLIKRLKKQHQAKALEKHIQKLITQYRYDYKTPYRTMGFRLSMDPLMEDGTVLVAYADKRLVTVHPKAMESDRRTALVMFLTHVACTTKTLKNVKGPYIVYEYDLSQPDGPSRNEQWVDYTYALEVLLPYDTYKALKAMGFERFYYVVQRVAGVSPRIIEQCEKAYAHGLPTLQALNRHMKFSQGTPT